jgi:hypothetical protein
MDELNIPFKVHTLACKLDHGNLMIAVDRELESEIVYDTYQYKADKSIVNLNGGFIMMTVLIDRSYLYTMPYLNHHDMKITSVRLNFDHFVDYMHIVHQRYPNLPHMVMGDFNATKLCEKDIFEFLEKCAKEHLYREDPIANDKGKTTLDWTFARRAYLDGGKSSSGVFLHKPIEEHVPLQYDMRPAPF